MNDNQVAPGTSNLAPCHTAGCCHLVNLITLPIYSESFKTTAVTLPSCKQSYKRGNEYTNTVDQNKPRPGCHRGDNRLITFVD